MTLIRTTLLSAVSYFFKAVASLLTNKIIAVYAGAPGMALLGHFSNFLSLFQILPNSVNVGVTKYIAEHKEDRPKMLAHLSTAFLLIVTATILVSLGLILFSGPAAELVLKDRRYSGVFMVAGALALFVSLNGFWMSILNGLKEIRSYVIVNICASLITLAVTGLLAMRWGVYGALLAFSVSQSMVFLLTLYFVSRHDWASWQNLTGYFERACASRFLKYSIMVAFGSVLSNFTSIILRERIMSGLSMDAAGIWQGMLRISDSYMTLAISSLSVYYLPRLSEIKDDAEFKKEVWGGYAVILPVMGLACAGLYLFREQVILLLYTERFLAMKELFLPQLAGDFFKIFSWLLGYITVAKAMTRWFMFSELLYNLLYVSLGFILIGRFGVKGAQYAYFVSYFMFSLFMIWLFKFRKKMV